jgi:hypothetical protein
MDDLLFWLKALDPPGKEWRTSQVDRFLSPRIMDALFYENLDYDAVTFSLYRQSNNRDFLIKRV